MSQQMTHSSKRSAPKRRLWIPTICIAVLFGAAALDTAYSTGGDYAKSAHGLNSSGVLRDPSSPRGSCAQCHSGHDINSGTQFGLFTQNTNELCFSASAGGCHADRPTGGTAGYPAQESDRLPIGSSDPGYFESNSGGAKITGVNNRVRWPGRTVWRDALSSAHYSDADMPIKDAVGDGACSNCHDPHGSGEAHDLLDTTLIGISGSEFGFQADNYALCLGCHDLNGPAGMDLEAQMISAFYDRSQNPGASSGHGVSAGGGYVNSGAQLPCYDCHNPHGSTGYGNMGANDHLLSDQRPGWYGLTDIKTDNNQVRRFCFGCHTSSDGMVVGGEVEGLTLQPLPNSVSAHSSTGSTHCYECHGRDYTSPTSNNVHNPGSGGDCITCHSSVQESRRKVVGEFTLNAHHVFSIGQSGSITNNDCGVCHMEGSAQTGDPNSQFHKNGKIDLRDPDLGTALIGFDGLTRDLNTPFLEPWVIETQNNFCLKCHDTNGASSPLAQTPFGNSQAPFSDPTANVIDVYSAFDPINSSYHPIRSPGTNAYAVPGPEINWIPNFLPPFNQTIQHDLISCFDCHTTNGHGSDTSGFLLTETYFREPALHPLFASGQSEFCGRCHDPLIYEVDTKDQSRFQKHDKNDHVQPGGSDSNRMSCRGCHAGIYDSDQEPGCDNSSRIGGIHGSTQIWSGCSITPGTASPAFLFGGYLKGWDNPEAPKANCYANCHHSDGQDYGGN